MDKGSGGAGRSGRGGSLGFCRFYGRRDCADTHRLTRPRWPLTWGSPCVPPSVTELTPVTSRLLPRGWLRPASRSRRKTNPGSFAGGAPRAVWAPHLPPPRPPCAPLRVVVWLGRAFPRALYTTQRLGALLSLPHAGRRLLTVGYSTPWIAAPGGPGRTRCWHPTNVWGRV